MKRLSPPKNQKAFILHTLINKKHISEQDIPMNGFRARISELINDHGVDIQSEMVSFKNTFGHSGKYKRRFISKKEVDKAIKVYNKIN
jgi:hypothetical protein